MVFLFLEIIFWTECEKLWKEFYHYLIFVPWFDYLKYRRPVEASLFYCVLRELVNVTFVTGSAELLHKVIFY